jgi:polyisoprenoid-binding protein YceI
MTLPRFAVAGLALAITGLSPGHAAEAFRINPQRTTITFDVPAVGWGTTRGTFKAFDGRLAIDFERPAKSAVSFIVQAASVTTGSPGVDGYIRSEVLFDAARHPTMRFVSTGIEKISSSRVDVTGDLTLLGVTQPTVFEVTVKIPAAGVKGGPLGFTAKGKVRRTAFGMNSGVPLVSDEVTITVSTEAQE